MVCLWARMRRGLFFGFQQAATCSVSLSAVSQPLVFLFLSVYHITTLYNVWQVQQAAHIHVHMQ